MHLMQHKDHKVPFHLTEKIDKEIKHLFDTNQSIKLNKCADDVFISQIVIKAKDKTIKITSDSKLLIDAIGKNKYRRDPSKYRRLINVMIPISGLIFLDLSSAILWLKITVSSM